jgi:hypothetical protein
MVTSGALDFMPDKITDQQGNFTRMPSIAEFASNHGLKINTEIDTSRLGEIGTKTTLENDENNDISGDSAFFLSF